MDQFLKSLRQRRAGVQGRIEEEQARPTADFLRLSALKKLRLRVRDRVEFIERIDRHRKSVPVPVVRRRSFRPLLSEGS